MAAVAAKQLGRPVKWTSDRVRGLPVRQPGPRSRHHGRAGVRRRASASLGMRVTTIANMGAYYYFYAPFIPTGAALKVLPGVYDIPVLSYGVKAVFTNTVPVDAYRGAGRPESIYCIERLIEQAARELGIDVSELRRHQLRQARADALQDLGRRALRHRRVRQGHGRLHGQGRLAGHRQAARPRPRRRASCAASACATTSSRPWATRPSTPPSASRRTARSRSLVGTQSNGQGHETAYAQVLHVRLGVPFEKVRIVQGDTGAGQVRRRHRRLALAHGRVDGHERRLRLGDRQGQGLRLAGVRGGQGRHHLQRRHVRRRRHRPDHRHHGAGARRPAP